MAELEALLAQAAREFRWPPTPRLELPPGARRRSRRPLVLVALAALLVAVGVGLAVPGARSAILRALHLEGESIERVAVLPAAKERPLGAGLGPRVDAAAAAQALGRPVALPRLAGTPVLHLRESVVSVLLAGPVLVAELEVGGGPEILKKVLGGATTVRAVRVGKTTGYWISGPAHLYIGPDIPPRLAGNALVWNAGGLLLRIEGRGLTESKALELAAELDGT